MFDYYSLTNARVEDKIVSADKRIFDNTLLITSVTEEIPVNTASLAPYLDMCAFVEAVKYRVYNDNYDATSNPTSYKDYTAYVGKWVQLFPGSTLTISTDVGDHLVTYMCTEGPHEYTISLSLLQNLSPVVQTTSVYLSSIVLKDSFTSPEKTWLNANNVDNIVGDIVMPKPGIKSPLGYTAKETLTGETWIDGRPVYQKTVMIGGLPATGSISIPHGIVGFDYVISMVGMARTATGLTGIPIPTTSPVDNTHAIQVYINGIYIVITVGIDRSQLTVCYITLKYVKV